MDPFRVPMAGNGPLCPTCRAPHFPFCHPIPFDRPLPPFLPYGAHPLGQPFGGPGPLSERPFRVNHIVDPQSILSNFPHGHNEPFTDNFASRGDRFPETLQQPPLEFQSAEAFFPGSSIPVHFSTGHPAFSHMGAQHPLALEHHVSLGTLMSGNPAGLRVANNWIEMAKERENQWFSQQERMVGETIDRVPPLGIESRRPFLPENPMPKVPRLDGNDNVSSRRHNSDRSPHKRGVGFRGDARQRAGEGDKSSKYLKSQMTDGKTEKDVNKGAKQSDTVKDGSLVHEEPFLEDTNSQKLPESREQIPKQGFSKTGYVSNGEPKTDAHRDRKSSAPHIEARSLTQAIGFGPDNTGAPDAYSERGYSHSGAGPLQSHIPEAEKNMEISRVSYAGPDNVITAKGFEDKQSFGQKRKGLISREEELLIEHGLQTFEAKELLSREEELLIQHGLQAKTPDMVGVQLGKDSTLEPAVQKEKRKRASFQEQPMSREEELLMEQGLLDDSSTSSESPMHQPFVDPQVDGESTLQNKQRLPGEEHGMSFKPSGFHRSFYQEKLEGEGIELHQPAISIGHGNEVGLSHHPVKKLEPFTMGNEDIKKWENIAERSSTGRFLQIGEKRVSNWPTETFRKAEELSVHPVPGDVSIDMGGKISSGESAYARAWHLPDSGRPIEVHPLLQAGKVNQYDMEDAKRRKDILHMQYQEWEAEQQHMEALKRAEELVREIQQRDENMQQMSFSQSGPVQDTRVQQQHPLEKRDPFHYSQQLPQTHHEGSKLQHSSQIQPVTNVTKQNMLIPSPTFSALPFPAKSDLSERQPSNLFHQSNVQHHTYAQDPLLQKQLPMIQPSRDLQLAGRQQQTNFQDESQAESCVQHIVPFPPQQSLYHLPSTHRQHSKVEVGLAQERHDFSQHKQLNEGWQPWQHQDDLDQKNLPSHWSTPQLQPPTLPLEQSHSIVGSLRGSNDSFQAMTQPQQQWQRQQQQQHQSQQHQHDDDHHYPLQPVQPVHSHYSAVQEGRRTMTDGELSLSQPYEKYVNDIDDFLLVPNRLNHYRPGPVQEPHRSFPPPLPSTASTDPLPPNSPPPLPPPTCPPLPPETPKPAPPVSSPFASAGPPATSSHLQRSLDGQGQSFQLQQGQNPLLQSQSSGPHELHHLQQMGTHYMSQLPAGHYGNQLSQFPPHPSHQVERFKVVDAVNIFRKPGRMSRPDRFAVILRGLPGSGKSYLAKTLRDVEVMNGGSAPRIHSMDDYFMSEVEKVEEDENVTSSIRSKNKTVQRVMEYCYEPEMEEAYRASMLKAFRKTLEEGMFNFVIVDDRNVLVADFAQFWAIAKRSGYEVYVLEAPYSDTAGCAARNVHDFTLEQIQSMADRWEPTPLLYLRLDVSSLFRGDDLSAQDIIEVEMDADDMERDMEEEDDDFQPYEFGERAFASSYRVDKENAVLGDRWEDKNDPAERVRASSKSKQRTEGNRRRNDKTDGDMGNALSGLMKAYGKKDKFVHWSDNQGVKGSSKGFSIGVPQKKGHLVIGPGPGYNETTNPVMEETYKNTVGTASRKNIKFLEQLRAEQEAFKAVFARRRQRIGGMEDDED